MEMNIELVDSVTFERNFGHLDAKLKYRQHSFMNLSPRSDQVK